MIVRNTTPDKITDYSYGTCNKTVNLRIDEQLLDEFKEVCGDISYQTQIKKLMMDYVRQNKYIDDYEKKIKEKA